MSVSKRLRYEILRRDNYACRYCGATAPETTLTVDHVVPVVLGGTDEAANLATACVDCNSGKTSSNPDATLVADVKQDALRWGRAREMALGILASERDKLDAYIADFDFIWDKHAPSFADLPDEYMASIQRFYEAGLPIDELMDAAKIALRANHVARRQRFAYMCGIAWKTINRITAMTEELLATSGEGCADGDGCDIHQI